MRCFSPPMKHPAFVKRFGTAIRPNTFWIAAKVNVQLYARLWPTRSGLKFPERLCAGSASSRTFLPKTSPRPDRFAERGERSFRHISSGRQEGRTRTIRFRVHPHPDFHRARSELRRSDLLGNTRNTRANANCHTWQDASVRPRRLFHRHYVGSKGKLATCESIPSDNSHYDLELKTPQAHVSGSNPLSMSMPGQDISVSSPSAENVSPG